MRIRRMKRADVAAAAAIWSAQVGTRMTRLRMRWLRHRACRAYFVVNARNVASKRLHERLGFHFVRELRHRMFWGGVGELWACDFE